MARRDTLREWLEALQASGWKGRKVGREWCGPCPLCGGEEQVPRRAVEVYETVSPAHAGMDHPSGPARFTTAKSWGATNSESSG